MNAPFGVEAPGIGQPVVFWDRQGLSTYGIGGAEPPCAAIITYVWSPTCVNLTVFDHAGTAHSRTSVEYRRAPAPGAVHTGYACSPPPLSNGRY